MKLLLASDHAGLELRRALVDHLRATGLAYEDLGPHGEDPVDYPDLAVQLADRVAAEPGEDGPLLGVLVCGTGIGMSITANKIHGVRAALCTSEFEARMSRGHNDANVLCLGQRVVGIGLARAILDAFRTTPFEGGRHAVRVDKIRRVETRPGR